MGDAVQKIKCKESIIERTFTPRNLRLHTYVLFASHKGKKWLLKIHSFIDSSQKTNELLYKTFLGTYNSLELDSVNAT